MTQLTYTERARLARQGCTVVAERDGTAKCRLIDGSAHWYAVEHLREIARPTLIERLMAWLGGYAA